MLCCSALQGDDGVPGLQGFPGTQGQSGVKGEICVILPMACKIIIIYNCKIILNI